MEQTRQVLALEGVVTKVYPPRSGVSKAGKEWTSQDFMVQYAFGQYEKSAVFQCFGDMVSHIPPEGIQVRVIYDIESREYNGRAYTNLRAYNIQQAVQAGAPTQAQAPLPASELKF